jgi:hypothetical protein
MSISNVSTSGPTCNPLPSPPSTAPLRPIPCHRTLARPVCAPASSAGPPPPKVDAGPSNCARSSHHPASPCLEFSNSSTEAAHLSTLWSNTPKPWAFRSSRTVSSLGESALSRGATLEQNGPGGASVRWPTRAQDFALPAVLPAPLLLRRALRLATYAAVQHPAAPAAMSAASTSILGSSASWPWELTPCTTPVSLPEATSVQHASGA